MVEHQVVGTVDLSHAALADTLDDPVATGKDRAGAETSVLGVTGWRGRFVTRGAIFRGLSRELRNRGSAGRAKATTLLYLRRAGRTVQSCFLR